MQLLISNFSQTNNKKKEGEGIRRKDNETKGKGRGKGTRGRRQGKREGKKEGKEGRISQLNPLTNNRPSIRGINNFFNNKLFCCSKW